LKLNVTDSSILLSVKSAADLNLTINLNKVKENTVMDSEEFLRKMMTIAAEDKKNGGNLKKSSS